MRCPGFRGAGLGGFGGGAGSLDVRSSDSRAPSSSLPLVIAFASLRFVRSSDWDAGVPRLGLLLRAFLGFVRGRIPTGFLTVIGSIVGRHVFGRLPGVCVVTLRPGLLGLAGFAGFGSLGRLGRLGGCPEPTNALIVTIPGLLGFAGFGLFGSSGISRPQSPGATSRCQRPTECTPASRA